jgi:hypothetical protein
MQKRKVIPLTTEANGTSEILFGKYMSRKETAARALATQKKLACLGFQ